MSGRVAPVEHFATIALLAGLLLPALGKAKARAQGIYCLNNSKQVALGWQMYAMYGNCRILLDDCCPSAQCRHSLDDSTQ